MERKDAIDVVKKNWPDSSRTMLREALGTLIPELREDEDENTRRCISDVVRKYGAEFATGAITKEKMLAWLEKQGKQKHSDNAGGVRFKPGDWIISDGIDSTAKIINIDDGRYEVEFIDGDRHFFNIGYVDENFHLWTIRDAKAGDVLINHNDEVPFIFKGLLDQGHPDCPVAYCGINDAGEFRLSSGDYFWEDSNVKPATKEQRDFLFSKMREAGYEWDAGNKSFRQLL